MPGRPDVRSLPRLDRSGLRRAQSRSRLALILLASLLFAQTADFKAETTLARIEVRAVDAASRPLLNLSIADFSITENDQPCLPVALSVDQLPLDLVLLIDVSGSMHSSIARVARHAHQALQALQPADRVALISFNRRHILRLPLTSDRPQIEAALNDLVRKQNFGGGTVLNTPIFAAAQLLTRHSPPHHRRAILVLSDGRGLKGTRTKTVLSALWEGDIALNALIASRPPLHSNSLTRLVEKNSGELLSMYDGDQPMAEILARIRSRYTLFYQPLNHASANRKVFARLSDAARARYPGAIAIGRRQYTVSPSP